MQNRPGLVTAVAIINIVFALSCGCSDVMTMAMPTLLQKCFECVQEAQNNALRVLRESKLGLDENESQKRTEEQFALPHSGLLSAQAKFVKALTTPRMKMGFAISGGVDGLLRLLLLISGIGLLYMAGWARKLAIGVSVALMVVAVIHPFVAHAVFGNEVAQAVQNMGAEFMQQNQEMTANLEKEVQTLQAQIDKDPQLAATSEVKANLQRTRSLLETLKAQQKQISAAGQQFASTADSGSTLVAKIFWSTVWVLLSCAWPIACILMLRTADVRTAFASS